MTLASGYNAPGIDRIICFSRKDTMRPPRFSIAVLMGAVLIAALDALLFRALIDDQTGSAAKVAIVGILPMATILLVGLLLMTRRGMRRAGDRPSLIGFEVYGWAAVFLFAVGALIWPDSMMAYVEVVLSALIWLIGDTSSLERYPIVAGALEIGALAIALTAPQLLLALLGGRRARCRAERDWRLTAVERKLDMILDSLEDLKHRLGPEEIKECDESGR
jgi:hypothetical protein